MRTGIASVNDGKADAMTCAARSLQGDALSRRSEEGHADFSGTTPTIAFKEGLYASALPPQNAAHAAAMARKTAVSSRTTSLAS